MLQSEILEQRRLQIRTLIFKQISLILQKEELIAEDTQRLIVLNEMLCRSIEEW